MIRARKPVLIDTSPLLLLLVGAYDESLIGKFKRVSKYSRTDFDLLVQFLAGRKVCVTPGVLAEVSNMAMELKRGEFGKVVDHNVEELKQMDEHYVSKDDILEAEELKRVGVTDTSLLIAAKERDGEILTADHPLCSRCRKTGIPATHMAELQWRGEQFL
ncbi:MAG: hypothetical protein E3J35_10330 [Methanomassiliicoccales archaeon]|nr:MAG: hypothetical protein E3J35_10330 [Methanomassiliicoccales archaeon]